MPYRHNASELRDAEDAADSLELELLAREAKRRRLRAALGVFLLIAAADGTLVSARSNGSAPQIELKTSMPPNVQVAYDTSRHAPARALRDRTHGVPPLAEP